MSDNDCTTVCAALPLGGSIGGSADDIACREYHAGLAPTDATTHCPHAGAFGADTCGAHCDAFCTIDIAVCGSGAGKPYVDLATCKTACMAYARAAAGSQVNAAGPTAGNTFDCRAWHLLKAADANANVATHCPHTAAVSTPCQ
jgi:hypothetical protein